MIRLFFYLTGYFGLFLLLIPAGLFWLEHRLFSLPPPPIFLWIAGLLMTALGGILIVVCVLDFFSRGKGYPAYFAAPERLIADGVYRYSRNPMTLGIVIFILGAAALFGSFMAALSGIVFFLIKHCYIVMVEEKGLEKRFGEDYRQYRNRVPRWI